MINYMNTNTIWLVSSGAIAGGYINYLINDIYYNTVYGYYPINCNISIFNYGFIIGTSIGYASSCFLPEILKNKN